MHVARPDPFPHTVVGGTTSEISGGKFANGATTAAMAFAFNQLSQEAIQKARAAAARERVSIRTSVDNATGGHTYTIRGEICSTASSGCNAELADRIYNEYVNRNDVPFIDDDLGGGQKELLPFGRGSIFHTEQPGEHTSINTTLESHVFHPGDVAHNLYFQDDALYYEVVGTGYGAFPRVNNVIGIGLFAPGVVEAVYRYGR